MPSYRDEGIVIRTTDWGEADRLVTILTRGHGAVRAAVRGVRRIKTRFGGRLEPFMRNDFLIASGRGFDVVSQAVTLDAFSEAICSDYDLYVCANVIAEIAERIILGCSPESSAGNYLNCASKPHAFRSSVQSRQKSSHFASNSAPGSDASSGSFNTFASPDSAALSDSSASSNFADSSNPSASSYSSVSSHSAVSSNPSAVAIFDSERQYLLFGSALSALARKRNPAEDIRLSYSLRSMAAAGWLPRLNSCVICGRTKQQGAVLNAFSVSGGGMLCSLHSNLPYSGSSGSSGSSRGSSQSLLHNSLHNSQQSLQQSSLRSSQQGSQRNLSQNLPQGLSQDLPQRSSRDSLQSNSSQKSSQNLSEGLSQDLSQDSSQDSSQNSFRGDFDSAGSDSAGLYSADSRFGNVHSSAVHSSAAHSSAVCSSAAGSSDAYSTGTSSTGTYPTDSYSTGASSIDVYSAGNFSADNCSTGFYSADIYPADEFFIPHMTALLNGDWDYLRICRKNSAAAQSAQTSQSAQNPQTRHPRVLTPVLSPSVPAAVARWCEYYLEHPLRSLRIS